MTVLSDRDLDEFDIVVDGEEDLQPSSIDLHLGGNIKCPTVTDEAVVVDDVDTYPPHIETEFDDYYMLDAFEFALGTTQEVIEIDDTMMGMLHGRSSVGRLGIFVENAGVVDSGYEGELTLELFNAAPYPIKLKKGMPICQLTVHTLGKRCKECYNEETNKYHQQEGATPSRLYEDFE